MKKRVLLISPFELCVGGVSKVIMTLVEQLHKEYLFDVVTLNSKPGYYDDAFCAYGGKIFRIPALQYTEHKILYPLSFFQIKSAMDKILKENRYDVIHGHAGWQDAPCHLAAEKKGIPVRISHAHGTYVWQGINLVMRSYTWFAKNMVQKYANVRVACSAVAGDTLYGGMAYENLLNPVNISEYEGIERAPHSGVNLLQIGYFCKRKNQVFSIKLLHTLRQRNINAHLTLIGYQNELDYFELMEKNIAQYGLGAFVSILPHDHDKRIAFAEADYCLLPSESEGLPLVALESQAAGVPCLMSDNISTDSDAGAGFFLPHDNLEKWADTIIGGVKVDESRLAYNLQRISTQAYADRIRSIYEQTNT